MFVFAIIYSLLEFDACNSFQKRWDRRNERPAVKICLPFNMFGIFEVQNKTTKPPDG